MIKIILPDKKKHSFDYNLEAPIKEILTKFCIKKGLLPDIYEVFDPKESLVIDENKSLKFYNLNILYLRRVARNRKSVDDGLETILSNEPVNDNTPNLNFSLQSITTAKLSNESPNELKNTKEKKTNLWKRKNRNKSPVALQEIMNGTSPSSSTKMKHSDKLKVVHIKPDLKTKDDLKKKRYAPLPPVLDVEFYPVIDIPSPPSPSQLKDNQFQSLPWLNEKCYGTDDLFDVDEYSSIIEINNPSQSQMITKSETPICTSPNCSRKTYRLNSDDSIINSSILKSFADNGDLSDPDDHVYSIIKPVSSKINVQKPNIGVNLKNNQSERTMEVIEKEFSSLPVSKTENVTVGKNSHFPTENIQVDNVDGYFSITNMPSDDNFDSDNSSIDTPILPKKSKKKTKVKNDIEEQHPKIKVTIKNSVPIVPSFIEPEIKMAEQCDQLSIKNDEQPKPLARSSKPNTNTRDSFTPVNISIKPKFNIISNNEQTIPRPIQSLSGPKLSTTVPYIQKSVPLNGDQAKKEGKVKNTFQSPDTNETIKTPHPVISVAKAQETNLPKPVISVAKPQETKTPHPVISVAKPQETKTPHPVISVAKPQETNLPKPVISVAKPLETNTPKPVISVAKPQETKTPHPVISVAKLQETNTTKPVISVAKPQGSYSHLFPQEELLQLRLKKTTTSSRGPSLYFAAKNSNVE